MNDVKVSFIVPVYNTPVDVLAKCVDSILKVKAFAFEIILIDDGSRGELSQAYCEFTESLNCEYVRIIRQENQGVSGARNTGIDAATGEYIMFVDSDDTLISQNLSPYLGSADVVIYDYQLARGSRKKWCVKGIESEAGSVKQERFVWYALRGGNNFCAGKLIKREYIRQKGIRFPVGCIQGEDADVIFQLMQTDPEVVYINCAIYQYNYSSVTERNRWKKDADIMILSAENRFKRRMAYANLYYGEMDKKKCIELICLRIRGVYQHGIDLCCVGQASSENRQKVEQLMRELTLPDEAAWRTRKCYKLITEKRWGIIRLIAKVRMMYLYIRQF